MNEDLESVFKDKTILVTGGCGSIGSEIVRQLAAFCPKMIKILDINESGLFYLQHDLKEYDNIRYLIGNIREKDRVKLAMKNVDIVFHAAALKHVPLCEYNPYEAVQTNIIGTQNLVDVARKSNIENFISISTDKAVNPVNTMGATKLLSEKMVLGGQIAGNDTKFSCVRFGNVLNSSGSVIPLFKQQIKRGGPVTVTHKDMTRFFMSIEQAVSLIFKALTHADGGEIFVLKMPAFKIMDLAEILIDTLAEQHGHSNIAIDIIGSRPGEKTYESLITNEELQYAEELDDLIKIKTDLSTPHKLIEGFKSTVNIDSISSRSIQLLSKDQIRKQLLRFNVL